MEDIEEWRDVPGYKGRYEISNRGRVRSLGPAKTFDQHYGGVLKKVSRGKAPKILQPETDQDGYLRVTLVDDGGKSRHWGCHVLVAMAWHPNPDGLREVAHLNHNRQHNTPENLKWASRSGNHGDSVIENRYARSGPNMGYKRTFTADEVRDIRRRAAAGERHADIARALGVRQEQVRKIVSRERWKHID